MICATRVWLTSVLIVITVTAAAAQVSPPVIHTQDGPVQGVTADWTGFVVTRYLGIPFGKPPTGSGRFMPPEAPDPWTDTLNASAYGDSCMQHKTYLALGEEMSEDCLHLNLYVPEAEVGERLPVMVWIHGGGLLFGSSTAYVGDFLAGAGDVIVVTINYRLAMFGFLATGDDVVEGNAGLMDQVLALRWVQNNIERFGGDKNRVTVFGESSGAWSLSLHLVSPMSRGLFQRAICESGSMHGLPLMSDHKRKEAFRAFSARYDCARDTSRATVDCLQQVAAEWLLEGFDTSLLGLATPRVGGDFLPLSVAEYWAAPGTDHRVELMMGVTSDEGAAFLMELPSAELVRQYLREGISLDDPAMTILNGAAATALYADPEQEPGWRAVLDQYLPPSADKLANLRSALDLLRDTLFLAPTLRTLQKSAASGRKSFLYYFDYVNDYGPSDGSEVQAGFTNYYPTLNPGLPMGAVHGAGINYVFGWTSLLGFTNRSKEVERTVMRAWTSFAKTGLPEYETSDGRILPWPEYTTTEQRYLEFKYPLTENSTKTKLLPTATSFFTKLLPAYDENYVTDDDRSSGDTKQVNGSPDGTRTRVSTCQEENIVSTIDRDSAETALFILSALVIVLIIMALILIMNYFNLKKQLRESQAQHKQES